MSNTDGDGAQDDSGTSQTEVECPLCYGAGHLTGGDVCEGCGGYGTFYPSTEGDDA